MCNKERIALLKREIKTKVGDVRGTNELFWELRTCSKEALESGELYRAINYAMEMLVFLPPYSEGAHNSLGWLIFKILKEIAKDEKSRKKFNMVVRKLVIGTKNLKISNEKGLYSMLFGVLTRLADENSLWFLTFIKEHGLEKFSEDDYRPRKFTPHGRQKEVKVAPLFVRVHNKAAKIVENLENENNEFNISRDKKLKSLKWFLPFLQKALERFPEEVWLNYHMGKFLLALGENSRAREFFMKVAKEQKNQFWIWQLIGETYLEEDKEKALSFLSYALLQSEKAKSEMTLTLRFITAKLLAELGENSFAKMELHKVIQIRENHQYKVPFEVEKMFDKLADIEEKTYGQLKNFYEKKAERAKEIMLGDLPSYKGIVENIRRDKHWVFVRFASRKTARLVDKRIEKFKVGDYVEIKVSEKLVDGKRKYNIESIKLLEDEIDVDFVEKVGGRITLDHKGNGHLAGKFIPHFILDKSGIRLEDEVIGIFVRIADGKTKCLSIVKK
jgi:tetratricopeptide (TPR) repeat protein